MSEIDHLHAHLRGEHSSERVPECRACAPLPPISTEDSQPVRENPVSPPTGRKCRCGCGLPVKNRFRPGHDAKLKSRLVKKARDGSGKYKIDAIRELEELGWDKFI